MDGAGNYHVKWNKPVGQAGEDKYCMFFSYLETTP
jgi:hypothetical protein